MAPSEVLVSLRRPEELFAVDPTVLLEDPGAARTVPGVEELLAEMLARRRLGRTPSLVVTLPAEHIAEDTAARVTTAVHRWCTLRREHSERETRTIWRQGLRSLRSGALLFLVGLLLSSGFIEPDVPEFWQEVLGNGVFLVLAWVGLWYPLDLLFFARQPLRREVKVLDRMLSLPVQVRPEGGPSSDWSA